MTVLRQWTLTVCIAAVISAIFELLIPDKKYERLLGPVTAAFAIYAVAAPLASLPASCSSSAALFPDSYAADRLGSTVERQAMDIVKAAVSSEIRRAVADTMPERCTVEVQAEAGSNGSITITGARLTVPAAYSLSEQRIKERAAAASGLDIENIQVIYE